MKALVTGMHRSGTSALAGLLAELGANLGSPDQLMPAAQSNPFGHFESLPVVALNDRLLHAVNSHWAAPTHTSGAMAALATSEAVDEAVALIGELGLDVDGIVKDPRFCLTMPFWGAAGWAQTPVVVAYRHPRSVAQSLATRNGLSIDFGLALWEFYHRSLFASVADRDVFLVGYDALLNGPDQIAVELAAWLELDVSDDASRAARSVIVPEVAATRYEPSDVAGLTKSTKELWEQLLDTGSGTHAGLQVRRPTVPQLFRGAAQGLILGAKTDERDEARQALAENVAQLEGERDEARQALAENVARLEGERDEARQALAENVARLEGERDEARQVLADEVARLEGERDLERERVLDFAARVEQLSTDLQSNQQAALVHAANQGSEIARLSRNRTDTAKRIRELEHERDRAMSSHDRACGELDAVRAQLVDVERERDHFAGEARHFRRDAETIRNSRAGSLVYRYWDVRNRAKSIIGPRQQPHSDPGDADTARELPAPVHFASTDLPAVSIVVPVHGQLDYTARCLRSIQATPTAWEYEVIVVDDVSQDRTAEWLKTCSGVTVVTNQVNLGFLRSTNAGADLARGSMLLLLNNDTEVHDGWLDALVSEMQAADDVGAVGSKLVYPDGSLQEAGGIIWSDGLGWNWGRGGDANGYEFNFVREVDYCSAACLLVRKDLWDRLEGFDERFVPAYYEDTDLAFSLRELGFKTLYQPASVVTHFEGMSHGTDESTGLKAHQVENRHRFTEKWASTLRNHHPSTGDPRLASWRGAGKRIVIFDHEVPAWDQDSGSVRVTAIMDLLVEMGFRVTFVPHNRYQREPYATLLGARGIEVFYGHGDWHELIQRLAPDLGAVIVCRPGVAVDVLPIVTHSAPDVPVLYDMVDFHGLRIERRGEQTATDELRHGRAIAEIEMAMVRACDATIAVTDIEAAIVAEKEPEAKITVLPNIHRSPRSTAPFEDRSGALFIGAWRHIPNRDAISFLCNEVMPLVWKQNPEVTLDLVGSDIPVEEWSNIDERIHVRGWVQDLDPLFEQVRCTVAPLRFGAGLKGKVGDSLMRGVPVVTTAIGAEGFGVVAKSLLIGETAQELADLLVQINSNEALWSETADRGFETVSEHFGYEAARRALEQSLRLADVPIL